MIKFSSVTRAGTPLMFLGLSAANVEKLLVGAPIHTTSATVGIVPMFEVSLFGGLTTADLVDEMTRHGLAPPEGSIDDGTVTVRATQLALGREPRRILFIGLDAQRLDRMLHHGAVAATVAAFDDVQPPLPTDAGNAPIVIVCAARDNNTMVRQLVDAGMLPREALQHDHDVPAGEPERPLSY